MKKNKLVLSLSMLGLVGAIVPMLPLSSCNKNKQEEKIDYKISDEYVTKIVKGNTALLLDATGRAYFTGYLIDDPTGIEKLQVEVTNVQGFSGTIKGEVVQKYENLFGIYFEFESTDYMVIQKPIFDVNLKIGNKVVYQSTGLQPIFAPQGISISDQIEGVQHFTASEKKSEYEFNLHGYFSATTLDQRAEDLSNFTVELINRAPTSANIELSIYDPITEFGYGCIRCKISNFTEDIKQTRMILVIRNKLYPLWEHRKEITFTFNVTKDVNSMFAFKKASDANYLSILRCFSIDKEVSIPTQATYRGQELDVKTIEPLAFAHNTNLEKVNIPNTVTQILQGAFQNCVNLDNVVIPKSVTELGYNLFVGCKGIKTLKVEEGNTKYSSVCADGKEYPAIFTKSNIGGTASDKFDCLEYAINLDYVPTGVIQLANNAFSVSEIKTIKIPNIVKVIGDGTFSHCRLLEEINFEENSQLLHCGANAFTSSKKIKSINIPDSCDSIGVGSFINCQSLTSIHLPTNLKTIDKQLFMYCTSLEEITVPASVKSISVDAFDGCYSLKKLHVGGPSEKFKSKDRVGVECNCIMDKRGTLLFGGSESIICGDIKNIGDHAFTGRQYLTNIAIPNNVVSIGAKAFNSCYYIKQITIPDSVTTIQSGAFGACLSLEKIKLPDNLTNIAMGTFADCYFLSEVTFPSRLKFIESEAFGNCISLKKIDLSKQASLDSIGAGAFNNNESLSKVILPTGLKHIGNDVFAGCKQLSAIDLPNTITNLGNGCFEDCRSLKNVNFNGNTNIKTLSNGLFDGCFSLSSVTLPAGLTSIETRAFAGCYSLSSITLPAGLTSIDDSVFSNCISLQTIELPESLTQLGRSAFAGSGIESISLPTGIIKLDLHTFQSCEALKSVEIKGKITTISDYAFSGCSNLETITLLNTSELTAINRFAFVGCTSLKTLDLSNATKLSTIQNGAFYKCDALNNIDLSNTKITTIEPGTFYGCTSLSLVTLPNTLTTLGYEAFSQCTSLQTITLPASLTTINDLAFAGCIALESITIPSNVTFIGSGAFIYDDALATVNFENKNNWVYTYSTETQTVDLSDNQKCVAVLTEGYSISRTV